MPIVEHTDEAVLKANGMSEPFGEMEFDFKLSKLVEGVDNQVVERPRLQA